MVPAIEVQHLYHRYRSFTLHDLSFSLPKGAVMGLIGHNGSGKTTLIRLLTDMIHPQKGSVKFWGQSLKNNHNLFNRIALVNDFHNLNDSWSVNAAAKWTARFFPSFDRARFTAYAERLELPTCRKVKKLSRGQQNKLCLALAFARNPDLLILDEPTSGLDVVTRQELQHMIHEFIADEKKSVLFSTHIVSDLEKVADYITILQNGRMVLCNETEVIRSQFHRVQAGAGEMPEELKKLFLTWRDFSTGGEGIIHADRLNQLPETCDIYPCDLESLIVAFERGNYHE